MFNITFGKPNYAIEKCDSTLIFIDRTMKQGYGGYSEYLRSTGGHKLMEDLEAIRKALVRERLTPGQCVQTPAYRSTDTTLKVIFHSYLPNMDINHIVVEQSLRLCYFNAFVHAAELGYKSIAVPLHPATASKTLRKLPCLVLLQTICIFLEKYKDTQLTHFYLVQENDNVTSLLNRKLRNYKNLMPIKKSIKLRRELEKKCFPAKMDYGTFRAKSFNNSNLVEFLINYGRGDIRRAKFLSTDLKVKTVRHIELKGGSDGDNGNKRRHSPTTSDNSDKRRRDDSDLNIEDDQQVLEQGSEETQNTDKEIEGNDDLFATPRSKEATARLALCASKKKRNEVGAARKQHGQNLGRMSFSSDSSEPTTPRTPTVSPSDPNAMNRTPRRPQNVSYLQQMTSRQIRLRKAFNFKKVRSSSTFEFDPSKLRTLQNCTTAVKELQNFVHKEIATIRHHILQQLKYPIAGPKDMSKEDEKCRQLCRMRLHVWTRDCEGDGRDYEAIGTLYEKLWHEFMGYYNPNSVETIALGKKLFKKPVAAEKPDEPERQNEAEDVEMSEVEPDVNQNVDQDISMNSVISSENMDVESVSTARENSPEHMDIEEIIDSLEREEVMDFDDAVDDDMDNDNMDDDDDMLAQRARKATEAARRSPPPHGPIRAPEVDLIADVVEELYGEQLLDEINEDDGFTGKIVGHYTKGRRCGVDCVEVDSKEAAAVHDRLIQNLEQLVGDPDEFKLQHLQYTYENEQLPVQDWINRHVECFQGLRSLKKRLIEISHLIDIAAMCDRLLNGNNKRAMTEYLSLTQIPDSLRLRFIERFLVRKNTDHHEQKQTENKFKQHLSTFVTATKEQETEVCEVCGKYSVPRYITRKPKSRYQQWLTVDVLTNGNQFISLCEMCRKSTNLPAGALLNNFQPTECPKVLSCLNVLERMLIERARSNMKVFYLTSITNKKTPMKATKGVLVVLPTQINATVNHVIETLPSGSGLNIQVRTAWEKKYIVSMPKIIRALKWLQANNVLYRDVVINPNFSLTLGEDVIFERSNATQADADALVVHTDNVPDDGHLLTQDNVEEQPVQPMHQQTDPILAYDKYVLRKHAYAPINVETPNLDGLIFPLLHPSGQDCLHGQRLTEARVTKYVRTRLMGVDRRWAQNPNWLIYMFGRKQQINLTNVQGVQARVNPGTTFGELDLEDEQFKKSLMAAYSKLRGYPQYWQSVKYELRSHVGTFGAPTWFLTLNPNIKGWTDLHKLYSTRLNTFVDETNIEEMIAKDPVIFSRFWKQRVTAFFKNVLLRPNGPLGTVNHYFYRTEYQHRGTQHVHCVLWTVDRPSKTADLSEVTKFIDEHVTARLPDPVKEKELHDLVDQHQRHWKKHSRTCKRKVRMGARILTTRCRFGFPRPELRQTVMWDEVNKKKIPGITNRPYSLARKPEETMINDYNPAILLGWKANVDVQYIPANAKDVCNYITAYTTKGEKAKKLFDSNLAKYALEGLTRSKLLFKLGLDMCDQREVGLLELIDDLMGHANFEFDMGHVFIPIDERLKRARILRPYSKRGNGNEQAVETNWLDTYYPNRQQYFKKFSLYNMMTNFEIVTPSSDSKTGRNRPISDKDKKKGKGKNSKNGDDWNDDVIIPDDEDNDEVNGFEGREHVGNDRYHVNIDDSPFFCHDNIVSGQKYEIPNVPTKCMRKIKQLLGRFYLPRIIWEDLKSVEDYYRRIVMLFVPWTNEEHILQEHGEELYSELWAKYMKMLKQRSPFAWQDITTFLEGYTKLLDEEAELGDRMERIKKAKEALEVDEEVQEQIEIQNREVDESKHESNKKRMNKEQQEIFDHIMRYILVQAEVLDSNKDTEKENAELVKNGKPRKPLKPMPDPIQMFVSGTAGTGKSFLINLLADELTLRFGNTMTNGTRPPVLLSAPTGIAALAINGNTIHSLLGIEVVQADHRGEEVFGALSPKKLDELKVLFSNVKLLIIDEVSMVSNVILMKIHRRLRELTVNSLPFGGYNVMLLGDLLQLPPVKAPHVFKKLTNSLMNRIFGTVNTNVNLWETLEYRELLQNMRQGKDGELAKMFERVRTGLQSKADIELMKTRCIPAANGLEPTIKEIARFFVEDVLSIDSRAMALFSMTDEVNEMNMEVLKLIKLDTVTIDAIDCVDHSATTMISNALDRKLQRPWQSRSLKRNVSNRLKSLMKVYLLPGKYSDTLMHGGLPPQLTVAVGSRVMLRRNISIRDRLVNGATGVVTDIVMNSDGVSVDWIHVRFDDRDHSYPIKRELALFRQRDEMMTRSQFPLVVSYGATIHKAQGLTLTNCLIRPRNIFAAGAFYVAVSRVTQIEGLYFAGFDATKIMFDDAAIDECNRLRGTRGIPHLRRGVSIPRSMSNKNNKNKKKDVALTPIHGRRAQRILFDLRQTADDVHMSVPVLWQSVLMEHDKLCESVTIAMVHIFAMMEHVHKAIVEFDPTSIEPSKCAVAFRALQNCVTNEVNDVWEIANACDKTLHDNVVDYVVSYIINNVIPGKIADIFSRNQKVTIECSTCKHRQFETLRRPILWIEPGRANTKLFEHIAKQLDEPYVFEETCSQLLPGGQTCGGQIRMNQEIGTEARYLLVGQKKGFGTSYRPLPVDPFEIKGTRFLLVGAVSLGKLEDNVDNIEPVKVWYKYPDGTWLHMKSGDSYVPMKNVELRDMDFFVFVEKPKQRLTAAEKKRAFVSEKVVDDFYGIRNFDDGDDDDMDVGNEETPFLLLHNPNSNCFLHAALNMLYRCVGLKREILDSVSNRPYVNAIKAIFNEDNHRKNAIHLRTLLPHTWNRHENQHNDAGEVLALLIETLLVEQVQLDSIREIAARRLQCSRPDCRNTRDLPSSNSCFTNLFVYGDNIQQALDDQLSPQSPCVECGEQSVSELYEWRSSARFHVVPFFRDINQQFTNFPVTQVVRMYGAEWTPVGFIEFQGNGTSDVGATVGHYCSWIKHRRMWYQISDDEVKGPKPENTVFVSDYRVNGMVFERISPESNESVERERQDNGDEVQSPMRSEIEMPEVAEIKTGSAAEEGEYGVKVSSEIDHSEPDGHLLLLKNEESDCFLNTIVNLLHSMKLFRNRLLKSRKDLEGTTRILADIFAKETTSVAELRRNMDPALATGWQDIGSAYHNLTEVLDFQDDERIPEFCCEARRQSTCIFNCFVALIEGGKDDATLGMLNDEDHDFARMFQSTFSEVNGCHVCKKRSKISTREVLRTGPYHVVCVEKNDGQMFSDFPAEQPVEMFGFMWSLISFSQFMSEGHYRAWIRSPSAWICLSDDKIRGRVSLPEMNLKNYQIRTLVFRKLYKIKVNLKEETRTRSVQDDAEKILEIPVITLDSTPPDLPSPTRDSSTKKNPDLAVCDNSLRKSKTQNASSSSTKSVFPLFQNLFKPAVSTSQKTKIVPKMKTTPSTSAKKVSKNPVFKDPQEMKFLLLENKQGTSCFLNVALNMIFACEPLRFNIIQNPTYTGPGAEKTQMDMLTSIFSGYTKSTDSLRATIRDFTTNVQDATSVLDSLLKNLLNKDNMDMWKSICVTETRREICAHCNYARKKTLHHPFVRIRIDEDKTLEKAWKDNFKQQNVLCRKCNRKGGMTQSKTIDGTSDYMIVIFDRTGSMRQKFLEFDRDHQLHLARSEWIMDCFAQHLPPTTHSMGHYLTWKKEATTWTLVDDNRILQARSASSEPLITMLVLRKL